MLSCRFGSRRRLIRREPRTASRLVKPNEMRMETMSNIKHAYRLSLHVLCASLLGVALLPQLHADAWSKSTKFTFTAAVQIPGQVLPAGTYVFRLLNSASERHVVQVFDEKDQHLIATVI